MLCGEGPPWAWQKFRGITNLRLLAAHSALCRTDLTQWAWRLSCLKGWFLAGAWDLRFQELLLRAVGPQRGLGQPSLQLDPGTASSEPPLPS